MKSENITMDEIGEHILKCKGCGILLRTLTEHIVETRKREAKI